MKKVFNTWLGEKLAAEIIGSIDELAREGEITFDGLAFDEATTFEDDCENVISVTEQRGTLETDHSVSATIYTVSTKNNWYRFALIDED